MQRKREKRFPISVAKNFLLSGKKPKKKQTSNADKTFRRTVTKRRYFKMTKSDLIAAVATKIGSSKKDSEK